MGTCVRFVVLVSPRLVGGLKTNTHTLRRFVVFSNSRFDRAVDIVQS